MPPFGSSAPYLHLSLHAANKDMRMFFKRGIRSSGAQVGGDNGNTISLQHNENYWMLDENTVAAYRAASAGTFATYPDYGALNEALGRYTGFEHSMLCATAGSDAAIRLIAEHCAAEQVRILLPVPTFYGYERILGQVGLAFDSISYRMENGRFKFPMEEILERLQGQRIGAVFLCQPNNPLGMLIPMREMDAILDAARDAGVLAIVDEAYYEFAGYTAMRRVGTQPIIILRTLSKAFGLAGARVGYYIAERSLIQKIQSRSLPWPIAHQSVRAALAGLERADYFRAKIAEITRARGAFSQLLQQVPGLVVFPSDTNFVFVRMAHAEEVVRTLRTRGILVAYCGGMSAVPEAAALLKEGIRMTVPAPRDQSRVVDAFGLDKI